VLLLHGFLSSRRALRVLERRLRRDGQTAFSIDLDTRGSRIEELAARLRDEVEALHLRHPGMGRLTIIGHSQGGLVGAWYVKELAGDRRVRALITLGTPHNGSALAIAALPLGLVARSLWQMTPLSPLIRRLRAGEWPDGVRVTSIYSHQDRLSPFPASLVETCDRPDLRNVRVRGTHRDFASKRAIYDVILRELRGREPAAREPPRRSPHLRAARRAARALPPPHGATAVLVGR
jgi:pimeloyl-ACP methyl ester carboxylesterase